MYLMTMKRVIINFTCSRAEKKFVINLSFATQYYRGKLDGTVGDKINTWSQESRACNIYLAHEAVKIIYFAKLT